MTSDDVAASMPVADTFIKHAESIAYWNKTPSTVSGMLGGFPQVSRIDITGSRTFLVKLLRIANPCTTPAPGKKLSRVADTGAGIGRITRNLLAPLASHIDVVEPIQKFTDQLRTDAPELFAHELSETRLNTTNTTTSSSFTTILPHPSPPPPTTASTINHPLESWHPGPHPTYDLIWNQWCLGHLTDTQLTAYLARLIPTLRPNGWIVVKENVLGDGKRSFPRSSSSNSNTYTVPSRSKSPRRQQQEQQGQQKDQPEERSECGAAQEDQDDQEDQEEEEPSPEFSEPDLYDEEDSSVTRSAGKFEWIFRRAGLRVVRTELQRGFGRELALFPVRMWGLRPVEMVEEGEEREN